MLFLILLHRTHNYKYFLFLFHFFFRNSHQFLYWAWHQKNQGILAHPLRGSSHSFVISQHQPDLLTSTLSQTKPDKFYTFLPLSSFLICLLLLQVLLLLLILFPMQIVTIKTTSGVLFNFLNPYPRGCTLDIYKLRYLSCMRRERLRCLGLANSFFLLLQWLHFLIASGYFLCCIIQAKH